ncbi:MAG TPA: YkvA family protein [Acidimicrobiales bacterium]|nr:YkvA family protein [Acidimicrobiales bacterium]
MPLGARAVLALAAVWVISPIDLVPEFLPVVGALDDVVVAAVALRYAVRRVPREAVVDAWPGSPAMLGRLLGDDTDDTTESHGAGAGAGVG